ncbi:MAG: hypothetical protein HYW71_02370 [Candidatus Niyogibacteria bacterium]|nr:hypothetical protein [Candidatus Niyogibacteria bacterium]
MKNLIKVLALFTLLSVFFYVKVEPAAAEKPLKKTAEEKEKIIWKNPLPKMIEQMKHRVEEMMDKMNKDFFDFPFRDFDAISLNELDNLIQGLDEKINKLYLQNEDESKKTAAVLIKKKNRLAKLAGFFEEYQKYEFFYHQGEEYIRRLKKLGWIIHYHDPKIFLELWRRFESSRYRAEIDKTFSVNFDRLGIFLEKNSDIDFSNALITGVIKYDYMDKTNKFREDMVGFYFRGHLNSPESTEESPVFELRWLDNKGQKHIVWHYVMPYPFPLPLIVENSLY